MDRYIKAGANRAPKESSLLWRNLRSGMTVLGVQGEITCIKTIAKRSLVRESGRSFRCRSNTSPGYILECCFGNRFVTRP
jgi:hypothetical protein